MHSGFPVPPGKEAHGRPPRIEPAQPKAMRFMVNQGVQFPEGKPTWPESLTVVMNKRDAAAAAIAILNQIWEPDTREVLVHVVGRSEER